VRRAIAIVASVNAFAASLSALLSTLPGVDFPGQPATAATEPPAPGRASPLDPRRGGRAWGRRLLVFLALAAVALGGTAAWAFWSAGSAPGSSAQGVAASVDQVTGLALAPGGVTPTTDPDVGLTWNAATLSNGLAVDGYVVRRYGDSTSTVVCTTSHTHCTDSGVPDGSYTYRVAATYDSWTGPESSPLPVTVDTSAPEITGMPHSPSANTAPVFDFTHTQHSYSFKCKVDSGTFDTCESPDTLSLADGPHTFYVEALDGNSHPTQVASYPWTIDTSPPDLGGKPSDPSANTTPSFTFTDGPYDDFECSIDGSPIPTCSSGTPLATLAGGSHTFQVEAIDADGIATQPASYPWTTDASLPTFTAKPTEHSANPSPTFSFTHAQSAYTFQCSTDGGVTYEACSTASTYAYTTHLPDGGHELDVEAFGADGIPTPAAVYDWTVDTSLPTITSTSGMTNGGVYASQSASFTLSHGFYTSFDCSLDGNPATCAGGGGGGGTTGLWPSDYQTTSETDCTPDANGFCFLVHSGEPGVELGVRFTTSQAVDIVGVRVYRVDDGAVTGSLWNASGDRVAGATAFAGTATHGWQDVMFPTPVPMAPGQTFFASYSTPAGTYAYEHDYFTGGPITVGPITAPQSVAGALNGLYCYYGCFPTSSFRDSNYWVTPLWTTASGGSVEFDDLGDGAHTVTAAALDADNYATPNQTFSWTVDHAPPTIDTGPDSSTNSTTASFTFHHHDFSDFECKLDDAASFTSCTSGTSYSGLGAGLHTFTVRAVDSIGGTTADQSYSWTVDTTAPAVTLTDVNGSTVTFPFSTSDDVTSLGGACGTAAGDSTTVQVTIDGSPADPETAECSGGTWLLTLTAPLTDAETYVVAATQSDSAGNTGSSGDEEIDKS